MTDTAQLEKVKEFLTCTICTDIYIDPCTLNCQHTVCRKCITEYTKTRPEALQSKTIPCPSCRQVTNVPDPTRPVEEWAWQIKPSIIILGLVDTLQPVQQTSETGGCCSLCVHLGETTPSTSWCPECKLNLCARCTKTHCVSPTSRDHDVFDLSAEVKVCKRRKATCKEHKNNCIEFHCKDCKKSACQICCIIYHRACKAVVTIGSMREEMASALHMKRKNMSKTTESKSIQITRKKTAIKDVLKNKMTVQTQIQSVSQRAIDMIRQKEKQLMDKLDEITEKQMSELQADVKLGEIEIQMYRQHCEFIDQAVSSECIMDMYNMYQACESETLGLRDLRDANTEVREQINEIRFTHDSDKIQRVLDDLLIGKIEVTRKDQNGMMLSPVLQDSIDIRTSNDQERPRPWDVTVLFVDSVHATVVTDGANKCVKSFYTRNDELCHSTLSLDNTPWAVTQLKENQVMVAVPESHQLVAAEVNPDLVLLTAIKTCKRYCSLAFLSPSSLAAGCHDCPDNYIEILTMEGQVMKSVTHHDNVELFSFPDFMCVSKGNLLVSDCRRNSVICLTSDGDLLWQYTPKGRRTLRDSKGITTTNKGDILLTDQDSMKVIQLTERGEFVRDILTSAQGLTSPLGIFCDQQKSLFVCDDTHLKEFKLIASDTP